MLSFLTLLVMLAVAYAQFRNGLFSSVAMLVQVILAGLVAFGFWEPLANALEPPLQNSALAGMEDLVVLTTLFCVALGILRTVTNRLAPDMLDYHGYVQMAGAGLVGVVTGYLVAGFLVCALQTMPLEDNFLGFEPRAREEPGFRSIFPPDRVWLSLMRHGGAYPLHWTEDNPNADSPYDRYPTFDRAGSFELRYLRYRRHTASRGPLPYQGELDRELKGP